MRKIIFGLMFTLIVLTSISAICAADDAVMENANIISDDVELNNDDVGGGAICQDGNGILNKDVNNTDDLSGGAVWEESDDNSCQSEGNGATAEVSDETNADDADDCSNQCYLELISYDFDEDGIATFELILRDSNGLGMPNEMVALDYEDQFFGEIGITDENGHVVIVTAYDKFDILYVFTALNHSANFDLWQMPY